MKTIEEPIGLYTYTQYIPSTFLASTMLHRRIVTVYLLFILTMSQICLMAVRSATGRSALNVGFSCNVMQLKIIACSLTVVYPDKLLFVDMAVGFFLCKGAFSQNYVGKMQKIWLTNEFKLKQSKEIFFRTRLSHIMLYF